MAAVPPFRERSERSGPERVPATFRTGANQRSCQLRYEWLRPTKAEIEAAYFKLYGKDAHESDVEDDDSGPSEGEESEGGGEEAEDMPGRKTQSARESSDASCT